MKKSVVLIAGLLVCAFVLSATDEPKFETFLGYNYVRFNPGSNNNIVPSFNANGGSGQFVWNFNHWIGAAFEAGAVTNTSLLGGALDTTTVHYVAGPRFSWHKHSRWMPYGEALFGGGQSFASAQISAIQVGGPIVTPLAALPPGTPISARVQLDSSSHFAMLVGGGLDIKLDKHIAFRPLGFDYYLTRLPNYFGDTSNKNNWRYMAGVNFLFGAK
jgi:hypothetical protein